jgi:osmoprotectant transport system permease protein
MIETPAAAPPWSRPSLRRAAAALLLLVLAGCGLGSAGAAEPLRIGSKRFTESYILAELLAQTAAPHAPVEVKAGLGNTAIVYEALRSGAIDVYPEYTGTIALEILKSPASLSLPEMRAKLAPLGLGVDVALGFNDGYALAMRADSAERLGIRQLSDLARHPALRLGLSNEFIGRADGWPGLAARYRLPQQPVGLDHGLAYDAVAGGQVDVIDIYTTDAKIGHLGLRVLADDANHFPRYDAVLLYRLDVPQRFPAAWAALRALAGRIDEAAMIAMNARAELDRVDFATIARERLAGGSSSGAGGGFWARLWGPDLARLTGQHLLLVAVSVALATLIGVPLALAVAARPRLRAVVLGLTGVLQTIPALALLAAAIALLGRIGTAPALLVLTGYALLPIVHNSCTGLAEVPHGLRLAAQALGLSARQRLQLVEQPLALPVILTGVRTAATIAVGTATIAAFIGAGGYGERIVTGLALNDRSLMLAGALPAALLALASEGLFALLARRLRHP